MPTNLRDKQLPPYTASGIGTLYQLLPKSFGRLQRKAAARALLQQDVYADGTHFSLKQPGGLHPSFTALHGIGGRNAADEQSEVIELLGGTLEDTLDAITMLDRVDGGVTLLIRTPGYRVTPDLSLDDITLDVYFSPRELSEGGQKLRSVLAGLMHAFGKDIALPHLQQFAARCEQEGIRNPPHPPPYGLPLSGKNLMFPDPLPKGSSHFRCRCCSSLIRKGMDTLAIGAFPTLTPTNVLHTPGLGITSLGINCRSSLQSDNPARALKNAIISIGSNTDAALDRFCLDDNLIHQLHTLVTTVRSSKWEVKLRGGDWGLSYEQAVMLSNALHADLGIAKLTTLPNHNTSNFILPVVTWLIVAVTFYYVVL